MTVNAVLTVEPSVTACGKFDLHERIDRMSLLRQPLYGSTFDVFIAGETMSRQVFLQGSTQANIARCQIQIVWKWSKGYQLTFCSRFWDRCSVCGWALSPRRNASSLRRPGRFECPQVVYDSLDFQARPVFQVGHHVELSQPYFPFASPLHVREN